MRMLRERFRESCGRPTLAPEEGNPRAKRGRRAQVAEIQEGGDARERRRCVECPARCAPCMKRHAWHGPVEAGARQGRARRRRLLPLLRLLRLLLHPFTSFGARFRTALLFGMLVMDPDPVKGKI